MADPFVDECAAILSRTPPTLRALLAGLPEVWIDATEGPGTWSPHVVVGHLLHCEKVDWMPRLEIILQHGPSRPFDPLDREAQFAGPRRALAGLLDEWDATRAANLARLLSLDLRQEQLELMGTHPDLGRVTVRQLLATWVAHDLSHLNQITRVMAKRFSSEVGPWRAYLSVLK